MPRRRPKDLDLMTPEELWALSLEDVVKDYNFTLTVEFRKRSFIAFLEAPIGSVYGGSSTVSIDKAVENALQDVKTLIEAEYRLGE